MFCNLFLFLTVSVKRIEKTKNRVKSDLEVTIKAIDSKHMGIFSAIESADSKRKKMEFAAQHIKVKNREFQQAVAKQKRLREIWSSFDHRENDLLNQEIRTIRVLDELIFFSIDDNEAELFENSAKISIMIIRNCLISISLSFWKVLIFHRYPFRPLRHSKNNGPLLQGVVFQDFML